MSPSASAFARLHTLQHGVPTPPGLDPVQLHLGEARLDGGLDPAPLADAAGWERYPRLGGTDELRRAYQDWLARRFGVRTGLADGRLAVEPTPGSKQAVAVAVARAVANRPEGGPKAVVMPNPFYPTYHAATLASAARPVYYGAAGDVADGVAAAVETADAPVAAVLVCSPGNPRGDVLTEDALRSVAKTAAAAGAVLVVDECYTDLWCDRPPPGFLTLVEQGTVEPGRFLVLHSLSKRSGAPGLRSGCAAGDPDTVAEYAHYNRSCGVSTPAPVCAAAAALWRDETHVRRSRRALARNWELADELLAAVPGYRRAPAGFFLWLPVDDDETTARRLWHEHALSVMPGRYLAADQPDGRNPGAGHLRIALVHPEPVMRAALLRLRDALRPPGALRPTAPPNTPPPTRGRLP
ncbi:aminotransferase class I/II-fold pyridoxal phosphate-dependent enzyme [Streptomyces sp. IBSBF 2806]|uniref:aminotransferase class I/II-fold pyridoxal phosphate-dependent enzyme n=1 Tax=Streptomyces sp. IBSBF 2806 TaxID=2903529 RepID=UPI002FDBB8FE